MQRSRSRWVQRGWHIAVRNHVSDGFRAVSPNTTGFSPIVGRGRGGFFGSMNGSGPRATFFWDFFISRPGRELGGFSTRIQDRCINVFAKRHTLIIEHRSTITSQQAPGSIDKQAIRKPIGLGPIIRGDRAATTESTPLATDPSGPFASDFANSLPALEIGEGDPSKCCTRVQTSAMIPGWAMLPRNRQLSALRSPHRGPWRRRVRLALDRLHVPVGRAADDLFAPGRNDPLAADEERTIDPVHIGAVRGIP